MNQLSPSEDNLKISDEIRAQQQQQLRREKTVSLHMFRSYYTLVQKVNMIISSSPSELIDENFKDIGDRNHYSRFIDYILTLVHSRPDKDRFLTIGRRLACNFDLIDPARGLKKGNIALVELPRDTKAKMEAEEQMYVENKQAMDKTKKTRVYHETNDKFKKVGKVLDISQHDVNLTDALPRRIFSRARTRYDVTKHVTNVYRSANARKIDSVFGIFFDLVEFNANMFEEILQDITRELETNPEFRSFLLSSSIDSSNNVQTTPQSNLLYYKKIKRDKENKKRREARNETTVDSPIMEDDGDPDYEDIEDENSTKDNDTFSKKQRYKKRNLHVNPEHDRYWRGVTQVKFHPALCDVSSSVARVYLNCIRLLAGADTTLVQNGDQK